MKITIYELLGLMKDNKAPKKIKVNENILTLKIGEETLYRFEDNCGSLCFSYYIDNNKLDNEIEILDKDFKLEEKKMPEKIKDKYCSQISKVELAQKYNEMIDYLKSKGE